MSSSTPVSAAVGQSNRLPNRRIPARWRSGCWLLNTATASGPQNSTATVTPSGIRAVASANSTELAAISTPSAPAAARPDRVSPRGRVTASSTSAEASSRSQVVPATPSRSNSGTEIEAPTCTLLIEAITSSTGAQRGGLGVVTRSSPHAPSVPVYREVVDPSSGNHGRQGATLHRMDLR